MSEHVLARGERSESVDGMRIDWDTPIPMDDGVVLRANVYRPDDDAQHPVLMTYGPYGKDLHFRQIYEGVWQTVSREAPEFAEGTSNRYQGFEVPDPEKWVPEGYAIVRIDSRGSGRSPGVLDSFGPREAQDYHDCIEWAAEQPWSSGKVGLTGTSYYAVSQWRVARLHPPHLAALCISEGWFDYYRDRQRHGGILNEFGRNWYDVQLKPTQNGRGERGYRNPYTGVLVSGDEELSDEQMLANVKFDALNEARAHDLDDQYYADHSGDPTQTTVPLLSIGTWGDIGLHLRGNVLGFATAAAEEKWLVVQSGMTGFAYFHGDKGRLLQKRFFDHFLKGEGDWGEQPRVLVAARAADDSVQMRGDESWPLAETEWRQLDIDPEARTLSSAPPSAPVAATYHSLGEPLTLKTEPFASETTIIGPVAAKIWLSSSTADADVFTTLRLFAPDGSECLFVGHLDPKSPVTMGWLRASHRKLDPERSQPWLPFHSHDERQPLTPGEVYELDVELNPTSIVVPAGYRLGLTIGGVDFDHGQEPTVYQPHGTLMRGSGIATHGDEVDRPASLFDGEIALHAGPDRPSYLLLPVIPR
jgi:uncharacterized protein